jgi:hypothetical protein
MTDAAYYRDEAERSRELAATAPDSKTARRWLDLADEYAVLAEELDASATARPSILRAPMHQQQSKTTGGT